MKNPCLSHWKEASLCLYWLLADFALLQKHLQEISSIAYNPPHEVATGSYDGEIIIWSALTERSKRIINTTRAKHVSSKPSSLILMAVLIKVFKGYPVVTRWVRIAFGLRRPGVSHEQQEWVYQVYMFGQKEIWKVKCMESNNLLWGNLDWISSFVCPLELAWSSA